MQNREILGSIRSIEIGDIRQLGQLGQLSVFLCVGLLLDELLYYCYPIKLKRV